MSVWEKEKENKPTFTSCTSGPPVQVTWKHSKPPRDHPSHPLPTDPRPPFPEPRRHLSPSSHQTPSLGERGGGAMVNTECLSIYENELLKNRGECFNQEHLDRIYWQIKFFLPHPLLSLPTFYPYVRSSGKSHQLLKTSKLLFFAHIKSGMNFFLTLLTICRSKKITKRICTIWKREGII